MYYLTEADPRGAMGPGGKEEDGVGSTGSYIAAAFDPATGKPLWNSRIGGLSNAPETYSVDGHQYLFCITGETMYAFTLY